MKRAFQIEFLLASGLTPDHYVLDLGCGTLRGGLPIIEYLNDGHYFGVEVRSEVLEEARHELVEAGLEHKAPTLICSDDLAGLELSTTFDYVWAFSVLIHMNDGILDDALQLVERCLAETGALYANVNVGDRDERQWKGFPVVWRPRAFYEEAAAKRGLRLEVVGSLGELGHVSGDERADTQQMLRFTRVTTAQEPDRTE